MEAPSRNIILRYHFLLLEAPYTCPEAYHLAKESRMLLEALVKEDNAHAGSLLSFTCCRCKAKMPDLDASRGS